MSIPPAGFREIEHTADWELQAWGPDIQSLFEQSARGMYSLSGVRWLDTDSKKKVINLAAEDFETLLVSFLSELLFIYESEGLGFDQFIIRITEFSVRADLEGKAIAGIDKEIKAVTYHNLQVRQTTNGWEANIVFDV